MNQLKLEEKENNATTIEEEEEKNYDEDVDDKLMLTCKKLQLEYEEQQRQHKKTIETADIIEQDKQYDLDFDVDDQPLTPPENFALVIGSIYRSSFPQPANFSFLKQLKLKSVLCLIPEEYPELQQKFLRQIMSNCFNWGCQE